MIVNLYGFGKKKNSTARPNAADAYTVTGELKDETSLMNPVIIFTGAIFPTTFSPNLYNYAWIPQFSRYYFVSDWRYVLGVWECSMTVDVLASYKGSIANETCYIERSASYYNGELIDTLYPAKTDVQITAIPVTSPFYLLPSGGCYILGIVNYQSGNRVGAVSYYALDEPSMNNLLSFLFSNNIYNSSNISEIGEGLFKSLFDPFQYIVSCMWMPGASGNYGNAPTTVKLGYWDTNVLGMAVTILGRKQYVTATIPVHPQSAARGNYLKYAPYTRITLFCPPFGVIPLDATFTRNGMFLYGEVAYEPISGQGTLRIAFRETAEGAYDHRPCIEKTALIGVPIQLAQVLSDYSGAINTLTGGFSGGIVGTIMGAIGATVQSAIASQAPKVSTNGANGSFLNGMLEPLVVVEHTLLVDEDNANLGRPLMANRQISTMSGYIKCADAHFSGVCYDLEKDMINQFMKDGFYYE